MSEGDIDAASLVTEEEVSIFQENQQAMNESPIVAHGTKKPMKRIEWEDLYYKEEAEERLECTR